MPDGVRSTLVVREAQDRHFGSYNCSVANAYGSDAVEILLKKQSEYCSVSHLLSGSPDSCDTAEGTC